MVASVAPGKDVYHLHEDRYGRVWVGVWAMPPICYDIARQTWLTMPPALAAVIRSVPDSYYQVIPDAEGCLISLVIPNSANFKAPMRAIVQNGSIVWQESSRVPCVNFTDGLQPGVQTYLWETEQQNTNAETKECVWVQVSSQTGSEFTTRRGERRPPGLYCLHPDASSIPFQPVVQGNIQAVTRDRQGRLWVGTGGNGVILLIPTGTQRLSNHAERGEVTALYRDHRGRLWCATKRGVMLRSADDTATWRRIPLRLPAPPADVSDKELEVLKFHETPEGRILVATGIGLGEFNERQQAILPFAGYFQSFAKLRNKRVRHILTDYKDSSLWLIVSYIGLVHCDKNGRELQRWTERTDNDPDDAQKIASTPVFSLYQDRAGNVWLSMVNGIDRWNAATKRLEHISQPELTTGTVQTWRAISFTESVQEQERESSTIAVSLLGTGVMEHFSTPEARLLPLFPFLHDAEILGLTTIGQEYWWSTIDNMVVRARKQNNGRMLVEEILPNTTSALNSTVNDEKNEEKNDEDIAGKGITNHGMMHRTAWSGATWNGTAQSAMKMPSELLFDYNGDAMRLLPEKARAFTDTAHLLPLAWYRNDSLMAGGIRSVGDTLTVPMNASFAVECALVSFARPERHRLQYRLEGLEEAWSLAGSSTMRRIRYAVMPPGVYRLVIRSWAGEGLQNDSAKGVVASDINGLWSDNTLVITILVPTPWYRLWWVQGLAALMLVSGGAVGIRARERKRAEERGAQRLAEEQRARQQEQVERLLVEFQLKTLRLQMDPHFIFNALTLLQELILENADQAVEYIAIFADILRKMLEQSDKHTISVREECALLERYMQLEEMRNEWKMDYEFHLNPPNPDHWVRLAIPPFIVQPYLENAIRHGIRPMIQTNATVQRQGKVRVELHDEKTHLRCVVEDNGIGRAEAARIKLARKSAHQHLSIATTVTAERLRLLQDVYQIHLNVQTDDLTDDNGVAAGTRVTVLIPYHQ